MINKNSVIKNRYHLLTRDYIIKLCFSLIINKCLKSWTIKSFKDSTFPNYLFDKDLRGSWTARNVQLIKYKVNADEHSGGTDAAGETPVLFAAIYCKAGGSVEKP